MTDLVERLRACADHPRMTYPAAVPIVLKAADALEQSTLEIKEYREALAQHHTDILTVLGCCRDDMPAEAAGIFQRIAKECDSMSRAALNHHEGSEG